MRSPTGRWAAYLALALGVAAALPAARAQVRPFHDRPVAIAATFGAERALARLTALGAVPGASDRDAAAVADLVGAARNDDLPLFMASLANADPALARALGRALDTVGSADADVIAARTLAERATRLLRADLQDSGEIASLLALLLTGPGGLADTFDDASDDGGPLPVATTWALLQRTHDLWGSLKTVASQDQRQAGDDALARIDRLVPSPGSGKAPPAGSSDDVEADAHQVVAALERASHASLEPDRDLAGLSADIGDLARHGCAAAGATARQQLAIGAMLYKGYLSPTVAMLAPDDDAATQLAFAALADAQPSRVDTCETLSAALKRVTGLLGG